MALPEATLHGAAGIAVPTLVSTLAISSVFTSVVFLDGPAKYLFTPLGLAVVFAMLASYILSRTLTPITIGMLLKSEHHNEAGDDRRGWRGWLGRFQAGFDRGFEHLREGYVALLSFLLHRRIFIPIAAVLILALGGTLLPLVGRDFFPAIDGGQIQLHVRAPAGTRIESTERIFQAVEDKIREVVPEKDAELVSLEEADDEAADSGAVKVEGGEDDEAVEGDDADDDTFLADEEEEEEDVGDIIGDVDEEER